MWSTAIVFEPLDIILGIDLALAFDTACIAQASLAMLLFFPS